MKLLRTIKIYPEFTNGAVVAIGNFDGLHLGHQCLLNTLKNKSNEMGLPSVVIIFEPQAREFFLKEDAPPRISTFSEKLKLLKLACIDRVLCLRFNQKLAFMPPIDFAKQVLFTSLNTKYLIVGQDFRFGKNRQGDFDLLKQLGDSLSCTVNKCPDFVINGAKISSTKVREALLSADFSKIEGYLGRKYSLSGRVICGNAQGRKWGVPTANLHLKQEKLSLHGVFCVKVIRSDASIYKGVANIGNRPTINGTKSILEVHILDFSDSLYGEKIEVL